MFSCAVWRKHLSSLFHVIKSRHNTEEFELFTLDDVDSAFDKIQQLKYSQTVSLKGRQQTP